MIAALLKGLAQGAVLLVFMGVPIIGSYLLGTQRHDHPEYLFYSVAGTLLYVLIASAPTSGSKSE